MRPANLLFALGPMIVLLGSPAAAQGQSAACFFEHANFQGRRMCFNVGQRVPMVDPSMNDKVSSVQVPPGVQVTICEHANFAGRCVPIDRTVTNLSDVGFNDRVSSVSVEAGRAGPGPGRQQFDGPGRQQFNGPGRPRDFGEPSGPLPRGPQMGGPPPRTYDDARSEMRQSRTDCDDGDRRACIRFGIAIGRNWERRERWRQESPEFFTWER